MSSKMQNQIKEMFELQNKLNINTNGEEWINGVTKDNRKIDWFRCIYMEAAEAIDSLNWKHWKDINKPDDMDNAKIEIVDIWHFVMSQLIKEARGKEQKAIKRFTINRRDIFFPKMKEDPQNLIKSLEALMLSALRKDTNKIIENYILIVEHPQYQELWNFQEVYALYIGKNCLNQFRQDNGYKEGTYKKLWNDKEDNVYMQNYIRDTKDFDFISLYQYLKKTYNKA